MRVTCFPLLFVLSVAPFRMQAQELPLCSWPLETTGTGITNVAYPDTNATYWTMPFDSQRWKSITITGTYPQSRFFSFVSYVAQGSVVENGSLNDVDIQPDAGSSNPFVTGGDAPHNYTITAALSRPENASNFLALGSTRLVWIIYRIYVPNKGLDRAAGVPLPAIAVTGRDGRSRTVPACPSRAQLSEPLAASAETLGGRASCQPDPLVSWIPKNTGGYFPNPANKYIAIPGLCFAPDRIVVVRGKGPSFPDTYNGAPVWNSPDVQMRYWSLCNNNQRTPYPVAGCAADHVTNFDSSGYYTYVISSAESRDDPGKPPAWIPADATWLPWAAKTSANILLLRNMLPAAAFTQSVQSAIDKNCVVDNQSGSSPSRDAVLAGGACAHSVMGEYYPQAAYCTRQVFLNEGWQGCFAAASTR